MAFYDFLVEEGGFKEENVTLLVNEEATAYRFDKEIKKNGGKVISTGDLKF